MKAIIHIGTPKAGSTTIQCFLRDNKEQLRKVGYYVPLYRFNRQYCFHAYVITSVKRMGKRTLSHRMGIRSQADLEAFQADFAKEAQKDLAKANRKASHVLLSAEGLSSCSVEEIERLRDLLAPSCSELAAVVYLRRQDLRLVSAIGNRIKNRGRTDTEIFPNKPNRDYYAICDRWAQVLGDSAVLPRIFPDSAPEPYNLIDDFAQLSGVAETSVYPELKQPGRRNEAWDWRAVEFNRLMNDHLPALVDGQLPVERKRLERILRECFPERVRRRPPRADAIRYFELFRESNERLRARWFPQQASLFREDFSMYPEQPDPCELSVEDAVFIASRILKEKEAVL